MNCCYTTLLGNDQYLPITMNLLVDTARKNQCPDDEYYTPRETAEYIVDKYFEWLQGKRIILPCDTENSELYKVCKERGLNCKCSQDMFNTDYTDFDIVFTNPPFSKVTEFIKYLNSIDKKFLLFASWFTIVNITCLRTSAYYVDYFGGKDFVNFIRPDGTLKRITWGLVTNLDEGREVVENKSDIRIEATDEWQNYRGIYVDVANCNYLKYDWNRNANTLFVRRKNSIL